MKRLGLVVHCLVGNEERFIWYALQSVLPFVEKVMVWDTGSTDNTLAIARLVKSEKIELRELGPVDAQEHTKLREAMLSATDKDKYDWLLILDGDEVWPGDQLREVIGSLNKNSKLRAVAVRTKNFVGDIYHIMPESSGHYEIAGKKGHLNLRFINLGLPDLHVINPYGGQTYVTNKIPLQNLPAGKLIVLDNYYFHATHLDRSRLDRTTLKRSFKKKYELGLPVKKEELPEVFFSAHPATVPDVTAKMNWVTLLKSALLTIPRRARRLLFPIQQGY